MNQEWATAANVAVAVFFTLRGHSDGSLLGTSSSPYA